MSGLSIIIPSRNAVNLHACVTAIRKAEETCRILVINDGLEQHPALTDSNLTYIQGVKPFVFARNVNLGIQAAGAEDIVILNDDAVLESPGGFTALQYAGKYLGHGLVSATTNVAGNPEQHRRRDSGVRTLTTNTPGNSFPTVAFVCVLIPRATIELVGLMDERFGGTTAEGKRIYGFCDGDMCRRIHNAGMTIAVHDGCFVDHSKLTSSFRSEPFDMEAARQIYLAKWGKM